MNIPKRINIRLKFRNITAFFMVAKTQSLRGISSKLEYDKHIILWDLDKCSLVEALGALEGVQNKYKLSHIYLFSDRLDGFCAICFTVVPYIKMLRILIDTKYIDEGFISYTAKRNKATLRTVMKENRPMMKVLYRLNTYSEPIPDKLETIFYDTGTVKNGLTLGSID